MPLFRISTAALGVVLLAACSDTAPRTAEAPASPAPDAVRPGEPPFAGASWTLDASGEAAALRLEEGGDLVAGLACLGGPARLRAESDRFQPIMSEDRFTVGAGEEAYALAADLQAARERGVEASGAIPRDMLDRLEDGGAIAFNYGAQNLGPFPAVPEAELRAFVERCRALAG
ncbi:MAG: hypothetical protein V7678_12435 [Brevundimonas sp.]